MSAQHGTTNGTTTQPRLRRSANKVIASQYGCRANPALRSTSKQLLSTSPLITSALRLAGLGRAQYVLLERATALEPEFCRNAVDGGLAGWSVSLDDRRVDLH
jgi:hypothetical protein